MTCFIPAEDVLNYQPVIPIDDINREQAQLELILSKYPDAPIEGSLILRVKDGYTLKIEPDIENNGFNYIFKKDKK